MQLRVTGLLVVLAGGWGTALAAQAHADGHDACRRCGARVAASREEAARILAESPGLANRTHTSAGATPTSGPAVVILKSSPTAGPFGDLATSPIAPLGSRTDRPPRASISTRVRAVSAPDQSGGSAVRRSSSGKEAAGAGNGAASRTAP